MVRHQPYPGHILHPYTRKRKWDALAEAGQPVDLTKWTELFTFSVIGKVGFGFDFEAIEVRARIP